MPETGVHSTRVCLALSVPLSGFGFTLLAVFSSRTLWCRFSGPSVPGVLPFRVLLPSKSRASLEVSCSLALSPLGYGRYRKGARTSKHCSLRRSLLAGQSLHSTRSRYSPGVSQLWGVAPIRPWSLTRLSLFRTSTHFRRGERGALEFFCRKSGTAQKERADPSAVSSLLSLSNLFDRAFVDGLFFLPDVRSRITAEFHTHP